MYVRTCACCCCCCYSLSFSFSGRPNKFILVPLAWTTMNVKILLLWRRHFLLRIFPVDAGHRWTHQPTTTPTNPVCHFCSPLLLLLLLLLCCCCCCCCQWCRRCACSQKISRAVRVRPRIEGAQVPHPKRDVSERPTYNTAVGGPSNEGIMDHIIISSIDWY